jgi:hypothetical protein
VRDVIGVVARRARKAGVGGWVGGGLCDSILSHTSHLSTLSPTLNTSYTRPPCPPAPHYHLWGTGHAAVPHR